MIPNTAYAPRPAHGSTNTPSQMTLGRERSQNPEALLASPRQACFLLGIGLTRCYELMNSGELQSFKDGKSRKITVASIRAYVERKVGESR